MVRFVLELLDSRGAPGLRDVVADMLARGVHDQGVMAIPCEHWYSSETPLHACQHRRPLRAA